ncbi:hypothetical protein D3C76_1244610 [compost metagenome]
MHHILAHRQQQTCPGAQEAGGCDYGTDSRSFDPLTALPGSAGYTLHTAERLAEDQPALLAVRGGGGRKDRHRCLSVATAERGGGKQDSVDRSKHFLAVGSRQHSAGPGEFCPNDRQPCEPVRSHRRCRFDPRSVPQARECWRTTAHRQNHRTHRIPRCDGVAGGVACATRHKRCRALGAGSRD